MKKTLFVLFCFLTLASQGQTKRAPFDGPSWQAPYNLSLDEWKIERFPIPIAFAPGIKYNGVEDLRFFKGWGEVSSPEYWSYAFLWYLDGTVKTNTVIVQNNLNIYYDGLIGSNISKRNIPADKVFKTTSSMKEVKPEGIDIKTYSGTISMLDYMTQKPIILNCFVHLRSSPDKTRTILFYQISPQSFQHEVWNKLKQLWLDFKF